MDPKIKVLHIMSSFGGGISSFIRNKAKSVDSSKIVFDIATFNDYPADFADDVKQMGGNIYHIPNPKVEGISIFKKTYQSILKEHGPYEMVHCHVGGHRAFSFYLLTKQMGINRFIVHAHSSEPYFPVKKSLAQKSGIKLDRILNRVSATQMVSCGEFASRFYFGDKLVAAKQVMHIPNSIDSEKYVNRLSKEEKEKKKKELNWPSDRWIVGHVGRFDKNKNHAFLIDLASKMKEDGLPFFFIFIGTGILIEDVKAAIEQRGLNDYIQVLGRREDVNQLYPLMDVFVLPSYSEGLPTVCVEAQSSGVPCIVSNTITHEIDMDLGMVQFAPLNDLESWSACLQESKSIRIPSMIEIENKLVEKKFSNEASARLYEQFVLKKVDHYEL